MQPVIRLASLDELRSHVRQVLCEKDQLDPDTTPFHQSIIKRSGRPCGLFFHVRGPRRVANYAVWAGEEDRILFYTSTGARFAEFRLIDGPDPLKLAG